MLSGFSERGKKGSMEYIVNLLYFREVKLIRYIEYFGGYLKGSVPPW